MRRSPFPDAPAPLGFRRGVLAVPEAVGLIRRRPAILAWLVPPFAITLLLDVLVFCFAIGWARGRIAAWLTERGADGWLVTAVQAFAALGLLFVLGWTFAWLFLLLSSPFQDFISAAVEQDRGRRADEPAGFRGFVKSTALSILQSGILLLLTLPVLLVGFLPVVGPVLVFGWSAFVMGFSFFTIPAGRTARCLSDRLALARRHPKAMVGLGAVVAAAALVPFLNVLCLPVFVIAGTVLYLEAQ